MSYTQQVNYKDVLLASEGTVKKVVGLEDNIDSTLLSSTIVRVQDIQLQEKIGTALIDEMKKQVFENNLTTDFKYLLDNYVTQVICYYTAAELQVPISFKTKNKGTVQTGDENIQNTVINEVKFIEKFYRDRADFYTQRLIDFLISNQTKYPQYLTMRDCSDMTGSSNGYTTGCNIFITKKINEENIPFE